MITRAIRAQRCCAQFLHIFKQIYLESLLLNAMRNVTGDKMYSSSGRSCSFLVVSACTRYNVRDYF